MRLNRYSIGFKYVPGSSLVIADTLSRAYPELSDTIQPITRIMNVMTSHEIPDKNLQLIKDAMLQDQKAKDLLSTIQNG